MSNDRLSGLLAKVPETPLSGVPDLVRRAYDLGRATEKARVADAHMTIAEALRGLGVVVEGREAPVVVSNSPPSHSYGDITSAVTAAISEIGNTDFVARSVQLRLCRSDPNTPIDLAQIRSALKSLWRQGKVERLARGQYKATNKLTANGVGQGVPAVADQTVN